MQNGITENMILCLYLARWKLYFCKVILAFIGGSHPDTRYFLLEYFPKSGTAPALGLSFFLLGSALSSLSLWTSQFPPSFLLRYLWQLIELNKMESSPMCFWGCRCVRWVTSYLHLSISRINLGWQMPTLVLHLISIYWLPTVYNQNTVYDLLSLPCRLARCVKYWFICNCGKCYRGHRTHTTFYGYSLRGPDFVWKMEKNQKGLPWGGDVSAQIWRVSRDSSRRREERRFQGQVEAWWFWGT